MNGETFSTVPVWLGAGAVAVAVHLVLVQQSLAAYGARIALPPPKVVPQIEIMAVASSVAGEERPVETVKAVQSETLSARTNTELVTAPRAESATIASSAPAARLNRVDKASAVQAKPATVLSSAVTVAVNPATKISRAAVTAPIATTALTASSITPSRPDTSKAAAIRSTASVAAKPVATVAGLSPLADVPAAFALETLVASPTPDAAPNEVSPAISNAPEALSAVAAVKSAPAAPLASVASTRETISAVSSPPLASVPSLPPEVEVLEQDGIAAPKPNQVPQDNQLTYQSVLDIMAEVPRSPCFAALPTLSEDSVFQLEVFAQTKVELAGFADELMARIGRTPNSTMKPISAAQCAAANFVSDGPAYPKFRLFFDIPRREIKSGEMLEGRIGNASGAFVSFLLIDDEGVVQDLNSFLQFVPGGARFRIPMFLTGSPVATQQLLMAISSPTLLQSVISMNGAKAEAFFPALASELRQKGHAEDVALVAFSVE
jgi:hypothetical protein